MSNVIDLPTGLDAALRKQRLAQREWLDDPSEANTRRLGNAWNELLREHKAMKRAAGSYGETPEGAA